MKRKKPQRRKWSRKVAADRLLRAVGDWVNSAGGSALVAGNIGVMNLPDMHGGFGPDPLSFYVCIKVTGRRPAIEAEAGKDAA